MNDGLPAVGPLSAQLMDFFIIAGAIGLVVLVAFIWAIFFRKNSKRRRKRRHRHHRSHNPTLAEIGGLPPVRGENNPDAQTPPP